MAKEPRAKPGETGHNSGAWEADLLALMLEMRPALDRVEEAKALVKKVTADYAVIRNKAEILNLPLELLDKALKLERQPSNRRGQQAMADLEYRIMKTLGLPVPSSTQGEMNFGSDEERDEAYWGDQGYQAGIRGDVAKAPDGCPAHLHQTWLGRRADGVAYSAWGKAEAGGKPDQGKAATTVDQARAAREDGSLREPTDDEIRNPDKTPGEKVTDPLLA